MTQAHYPFVLGVLALSWLALVPLQAQEAEPLRLNQLQMLGSHNSYKEAISPKLLAFYSQLRSPEAAQALDYWHPRLATQLDLGLRKLELDIFHDPQGGLFSTPKGLEWAPESGELAPEMYDLSGSMDEPGFKVLHVQDLDFRSNCPSWIACLLELRTWSETHPDHLPILVMINAKDGEISGFTEVLPFDTSAFRALDEATLRVLGRDRLLLPEDVKGERATLDEAVRLDGWPALDQARGRFLFALDEGEEKREAYLDGWPEKRSQQPLVFFVNVPAGHPAAAIRILNDPFEDRAEIERAVRSGYLVRTRTDANTEEARVGESGDTRRLEAALTSGAHYLSTDFYLDEQSPDTSYLVALPARAANGARPAARCNPETAAAPCTLLAVSKTPDAEQRLIAHRGGVVNESHTENTLEAALAAIANGYSMLEVDLRETRDGAFLVHHDETFERFYGDTRTVSSLNRNEVETLRMKTNGAAPLFLDQLLEALSQQGPRVQLMLDWKSQATEPAAFSRLAAQLRAASKLQGALVIGSDAARDAFIGKAKVGRTLREIEARAAAGEPVAQRYVLFAHGRDLTAEQLLRAKELNVEVVPSVNQLHYADLVTPEAAARHDLIRLRAMGVHTFQIDSLYAPHLSEDAPW